MTATMPERTTRRPTGLPSWPIGLLTGPEKTGKTFRAAEASASELVGGTFWLSIGEDDPDEYGAIPGADFQIVDHDGTFRDFLAAVTWAVDQPPVTEGKPNLIVVDSGTRLWDLICNDLQDEANARDRRKAAKFHRAPAEDDVTITMDLWNLGKQRWQHVMDELRRHQGPSLITARQDVVTVMDGDKPTKEKTTSIKAEKTLPFDVGFTVEFPEPGEAVVTGVRSLRVKASTGTRKPFPNFTLDTFWRALGLADAEVGERTHSRAGVRVPDRAELAADVARAETEGALRNIWHTAGQHGMLDLPADEDGTPLRQLIQARLASLAVIAAAEAETRNADTGAGGEGGEQA